MRFTRRLQLINEPFLDEHALVAALPGLTDDGRRALFLRELEHSVRLNAYRCSFIARRGPVEPLKEGWHPWAAIATLSADRADEAIWLAFLTTFFGPDERRPDTWRATRAVYSAFGAERLTYTRVREDPDLVRRLCHANDALFRSLPRGNHRKYEPKDAEHKQGLINSVASLLALAAAHGGLGRLLLAGASAEARFERLMQDFHVVSFARTGRFDLLVLLGDLAVVELTPPRLYLTGATGPLEGARIALPGTSASSTNDLRRSLQISASRSPSSKTRSATGRNTCDRRGQLVPPESKPLALPLAGGTSNQKTDSPNRPLPNRTTPPSRAAPGEVAISRFAPAISPPRMEH